MSLHRPRSKENLRTYLVAFEGSSSQRVIHMMSLDLVVARAVAFRYIQKLWVCKCY